MSEVWGTVEKTRRVLQATSLPFIVAGTGIGMEFGVLSPATGTALMLVGLLSAVVFPLSALTLLRADKGPRGAHRRDVLGYAVHKTERT